MGKWKELYDWVNGTPGNWAKIYRLPEGEHASVEVGWLDDRGAEVSVRTTVAGTVSEDDLSEAAAHWALATICDGKVNLVEAVAAGADKAPMWRVCCDRCHESGGFSATEKGAADLAESDGWRLEDGGTSALCPDCLNDEV